MDKIKILNFSGIDFLKAISPEGDLYHLLFNRYIFRGHSSEKWELIPSALRLSAISDVFYNDEHQTRNITFSQTDDYEVVQISKEINILRNFFEKCDKHGLPVPEVKRLREEIFHAVASKIWMDYEEWIPSDFHELVSMAQHYGIPTRLLDWSYDILVSLYFAISGLRNLSVDERTDYFVIWALDTKLADPSYHPKTSLRMVRPRYNGNANITAQKGVFTYWATNKGVNPTTGKCDMVKTNRNSLDKLVDESFMNEKEPLMYCIKIASKDACVIYDYLKCHHIEAATIYPGFRGVVQSINESQQYIKRYI